MQWPNNKKHGRALKGTQGGDVRSDSLATQGMRAQSPCRTKDGAGKWRGRRRGGSNLRHCRKVEGGRRAAGNECPGEIGERRGRGGTRVRSRLPKKFHLRCPPFPPSLPNPLDPPMFAQRMTPSFNINYRLSLDREARREGGRPRRGHI